MNKRHWQKLTVWAFRGLLAGLRVCSWRGAQRIGAGLGRAGFRLSARYRAVADKNLQIACGDTLTHADRERITRGVFVSFGQALLEFLKAPSLSPFALRELVCVDTFAPVDALLARGKGLIIVTAHLGNWEMVARRAGLEGYNVVVVARVGNDPALDALTESLREKAGYRVHPRGASPKALLQQLKAGKIVAILPDQKSDNVFVPFFGALAGTVAGPAVLSLKTGAPILPMFCIRQPDGKYVVEIGPEIDTAPTGNDARDTERIMSDVNLAIENVVRRFPDQWLWLHDRWRMPPPEHPIHGALAVSGTH